MSLIRCFWVSEIRQRQSGVCNMLRAKTVLEFAWQICYNKKTEMTKKQSMSKLFGQKYINRTNKIKMRCVQ